MKAAGRYDCSNSSPVRMKGIPPGGEDRRQGQSGLLRARERVKQKVTHKDRLKTSPPHHLYLKNKGCTHLLFNNLGIRVGWLVKNKLKNMNCLQQMSTLGCCGGEKQLLQWFPISNSPWDAVGTSAQSNSMTGNKKETQVLKCCTVSDADATVLPTGSSQFLFGLLQRLWRKPLNFCSDRNFCRQHLNKQTKNSNPDVCLSSFQTALFAKNIYCGGKTDFFFAFGLQPPGETLGF